MASSLRFKVALLIVAALGGAVVAAVIARDAGSRPLSLTTPSNGAAGKIAAFANGGSPPATVPAAVRAFMERRNASLEGAALADWVVLAASRLGRQSADVWLYPTTKGAACFIVLVGEQSGGCVMRFDRAIPSAVVVHRGTNVPTTVVGVAPRTATAVDVVVHGGGVHNALQRNDVVFWEAADMSFPPEGVDAVITRFADGTSIRQEWGGPAH
ncbi:MAG: hypothetical protein WKF65_10720 [Gaiellaceae bacterium]